MSRPPQNGSFKNAPHMSTSRCGKITPPKHTHNERRVTFIHAVVLLLLRRATMSWRRCVFCCESESTLFGLPNEYTTRNQGLSYIYNTVPEQYNTNIWACALSAFYGGLFLGPGRVAYNLEKLRDWGGASSLRPSGSLTQTQFHKHLQDSLLTVKHS